MSKLSELPIYNDAPSGFYYILTKAETYLRLGPQKYRKRDFLNLPSEKASEEELKNIENGMKQLMNGCGYKSEKPLDGIGVHGFYCLIEVLHFKAVSQSAKILTDGILDMMECEHFVTKKTIALYNLVSHVEYE